MPPPHPLSKTGLPALFRIGAQPLGDAPRFMPGGDLARYVTEKQQLAAKQFDAVFMAEPDTEAAQAEVLALVLDETEATALVPDAQPLWAAAQLVAEDLVIMRKGEAGWRLTAGAVCFPSSWRLKDKFGKPLDQVHAPVPDFGASTRNASLITRMFDNLRPETPMIRWNWSLYGDGALHHPEAENPGPGWPLEGDAQVFLRAERQTLSKLPQSGDILFTIRIFVDPLEVVTAGPEGTRLAEELIAELERFDSEQLAYKGMAAARDGLLARLRELTSNASGSIGFSS